MSQIESIRQMAELGKSVREICREQHADYRTVGKYLNRIGFSEELPVKVRENQSSTPIPRKSADCSRRTAGTGTSSG